MSAVSQTLFAGSRPKILVLGFDVGYINPTRERLVETLSAACDTYLFGPGYQPSTIIELGLEEYAGRHGPFDFVFADEFSMQNFAPLERGKEMRFVNHSCRFNPKLLAMGKVFHDFLAEYKGPRILGLLHSDFYNFTELRIEQMRRLGDYYITWGPEFIWPRTAFDASQTPVQGIDQSITERWTDRYRDFAHSNKDRLISCPHFIGAVEFGGSPLAQRTSPWANLGADYTARVVARTKLDSANLRRTGRWLPQAFSVASRLKFNVYNKYWTIALLQWGFRRTLRQAKYAFTCGSVLRWPIRKYFEIPANGAVLVCERPEGFEALGFEDGRNAVVCDARDILDAHAWLEASPDQAQNIADAGRELVRTKHSVDARSQQIGVALQRILDGSFSGSRWHNGEFELVGKC